MPTLPKAQKDQVQFSAAVAASAFFALWFYENSLDHIGQFGAHVGAVLIGILAAYATSWVLGRFCKETPDHPPA